MNSLKSKIVLMIMLALSVLQFSLVMMMTHDSHENMCAFDEHCILQTVITTTEAVLPLLAIILPAIFIFTLLKSPKQEAVRIASSPPNFNFRQTLKGVIQRE